MADTIRINADTSQAVRSINNLEQKLGGVTSAFAKFTGALAGLAIGATITRLFSLGNQLADLSATTNISIQSIAGLGEALGRNSGSFDQANGAVLKFTETLGQAFEGSAKTQEAFGKIGVSLQDLRTLSEQDLLRKTVLGLGQVGDVGTRAALTSDLFGKSLRGADLAGVARDLDSITARKKDFADAAERAGSVNQKLQNSFRVLQERLLLAIAPLADFLDKLQTEQIDRFINAVVDIGAALLSIAASIKVFQALGAAVLYLGGLWAAFKVNLLAVGTAIAGITATFTNLTAGLARMGVGFSTILTNGYLLRTLLAVLAGFVVALSVPLAKIVGISAAVAGSFYLIIKAIDALFNTDIAGWFDRAGAALARFLGISYKTAKEKEALAAAEQKSASEGEKAADRKVAAEDKVRDVTMASTKEINKQLASYKESNAEALKQIQNNTKLIGLSEEQKAKRQALFDVEAKRAKEVAALTEKMNASQMPEQKAAYAAAIAKVNNEFARSKTEIQGAVDAQAKKTRQEQLSVFANQQLVSAIQQLNDLNQQAATALLPELEKKYRDIEFAARAAAEAQIAAEEQRRGAPLSEQERAKYLEAARVKTDELRAATERLDSVERQRAFNNFALSERIDLENQLQRIQDDTAKITMTEIERKEYDIAAAAKARAKAQIDAAQAQRGSPLNAQEQQAYYDAAIEGVKKLQDAERARFEESRTWNAGWKKAFNDYKDDATNAAKAAENIFKKATSGMEDAIVGFAKKGKFEFKGFLNSMLEELLRSQVRQLMASLFSGSSGRGGGSFFGSLGSLLGFANGGVIPTNGPVIVGERGPELLMGAAGRTVIPNEALGGNSVTYNINAVDALSFKQMVAADPTFLFAITEQGRRRLPGAR